MEEKKDNSKVNTAKEKRHFPTRMLIVLGALLLFGIYAAVSLRADYLNIVGINENYYDVFYKNVTNKYLFFIITFIVIYLYFYIMNKFIKKGLKKFFEEENRQIPKLPNKSISLLFAIIFGVVSANTLAEKFLIFENGAVFGQTDPVFGADIGYYMFSLPFITSILIFLLEVLVVTIVYIAIYYVICLNVYFDGVSGETLKKNTFIKQELLIVVLITIVFCAYVFINSQNILTGNMVEIKNDSEIVLVGAGKTDVTIKLWGYRIFSFVIAIAVLRLLKYVKKQNFKQGFISAMIVPVYLIGMFIVITYFQVVHVSSNELDNEKEYIGYNIKNTKEAYGIDIKQKNIENYKPITIEETNENQKVIENIPLITKDVTSTAIAEHQENSVYYAYNNTFLANYNVNNKERLLYITPREILNDSTISYNNRTLKYTHGYSAVVSSATDSDDDGYAEYILSDFSSQNILNIKEPRIYFGLETNSTIMVNTRYGKEYDYPITASTYEENVYVGKAGLKLGFIDRLILGISEKNLKLAFSSNITDDTKIISKRNVIERAKTLLPNVLYDENPYLVITDEGKLVWVLDAYTRSNEYPYSQTTQINIKGYKEKINYIRNSVKVLIDAYDGDTTFYITDKSDPIIMTYRNIYPDLFTEDELPKDICKHLVYPEFLYSIQANLINLYHDISEDTLYRADDIWQITTKASTKNSTVAGVEMKPYYTYLKKYDDGKPEFGLVLTYNKYGKQNIISYLVGTVNQGKSELSLYKFNSENNIVGIIQLNNQIEQDATISKELEQINTTGTKLIKDMIIVPINNSLLYIEPVYQVLLNESEIPVLKKVIVASGNTVAIGDNLKSAIVNLFNDDYAVDLDIVNPEDINALIDSVIKANNNLNDSLNSNNFEMIGKDIKSLQSIINQLETARTNEIAEEERQRKEEESRNSLFRNDNTIDTNELTNDLVQNDDITNKIN